MSLFSSIFHKINRLELTMLTSWANSRSSVISYRVLAVKAINSYNKNLTLECIIQLEIKIKLR